MDTKATNNHKESEGNQTSDMRSERNDRRKSGETRKKQLRKHKEADVSGQSCQAKPNQAVAIEGCETSIYKTYNYDILDSREYKD